MYIINSKELNITIIKIDNKKFNLNRINSFKSYVMNHKNKDLILKELKIYQKNNNNEKINKLLEDLE